MGLFFAVVTMFMRVSGDEILWKWQIWLSGGRFDAEKRWKSSNNLPK